MMIKEEDIAICPKMTKIEYDMRRLNLDEQKLLEFYEKEGVDALRIIQSNNRQVEGLANLRKIFPKAHILKRDHLSKKEFEKYKLIISYGGDNHFQYVSHFVGDQLVLGINSDPLRSEGALTSIDVNEIKDKDNLLSEKFEVEEWTRLKVKINGKEVEELSSSDIFIGEKVRYQMSRLLIDYQSKSYEQKGSGIVITTGAGFSGWYDSASRYITKDKENCKKTDKKFIFVLTEPYSHKLTKVDLTHGELNEGEELNITSLCDFQAIVAIDALKIIEINEGSKINISFGKPLRIIKIK